MRLLGSTYTYFRNGIDAGLELVSVAGTFDCRVLILEFSQVQHIDSQFLACLVVVHRQLQRMKGALRLTGLCPHLRELFERTHLDQVIRVLASAERLKAHAAVASHAAKG